MIDKLMSGSSLENTIVPNSSSTKKVKSFVPKTSKQVLQLRYWDLHLNKKLRASITEASIPSSYAGLEWDIYYDILNWFILSGKLSTDAGSGSLIREHNNIFLVLKFYTQVRSALEKKSAKNKNKNLGLKFFRSHLNTYLLLQWLQWFIFSLAGGCPMNAMAHERQMHIGCSNLNQWPSQDMED